MSVKKAAKLHHYALQSLYAGIFIWLVLLGLDQVSNPGLLWAVGATSVASSTFIVFSRPWSKATESIRMIGAYLLSVLVGIVCAHLDLLLKHHFVPIRSLEIATAVSLGLTTFLMTMLSFQHPPAAGMALVLVLEPWGFGTVIVVVIAILILTGIKHLFKPYMVNLVNSKD